ncbi:phosphoenolpyruvate--protein phosphotransferase [Chromobacterium sp. ATCC 53434]|uniref:phosphoenolpyruvate--protein phosphotransferase n=1 Tax=Chromobacterium sp. (strain ATCC 53434 / SC 14030) TaxID=2059672 RepID=UPI000C79018E|nr:phosphoenolpyruvate--protein phosphotransferase [Chromobacterium sp. ATCC 53434]AUH53351.1 phosphoenolpyruvate--protein phosphotransferase [Chromobacterium sp. ATCC 53434]
MTITLELLAPFSGPAIPLERVPDPVFAGLMMGDGLAVEPMSSTLLAPCKGTVGQLARTGHALTLIADGGVEVLIHIGIDTVKLAGQGFRPLVAVGDRVAAGQPLVEVDLDAVARRAPSLQTMVVVADAERFCFTGRAEGWLEAGRSPLLTLTAREAASSGASADGPEREGEAVVGHEGGLHARPSARVQQAVKAFASEVIVEFGGKQANARSVMALMSLGVAERDTVAVRASGADAEAALAAVVAVLETHSAAGHAPVAVHAAPAVAGRLAGVAAAPGLAIGRVVRLDVFDMALPEAGAGALAERERLSAALRAVRERVQHGIDAALRRGATAESDIFAAHLALLDDPELLAAAERGIDSGAGAGLACRLAIRAQCAVLAGLGNQLLAERVADLKDIERQLLVAMYGEPEQGPALFDASILVAEDLAPSALTRLPRAKVAGIVTAAGGASGHVAILARALGIPALVACGPDALSLTPGQALILDARAGLVNPRPSEAELDDAAVEIARLAARERALQASAKGPAITLDGAAIEVAVNIANADDAREGVAHGADAVGLLRTEFLFIDRREAPTEDEQTEAYQAVLDALDGRNAIIRTLDIGGDKDVPYLQLPPEPNPALGLRGIRTGFAYPDMLDAQLRALLRVKPLSRLRILVPMIADVGELIRLRGRIEALAGEMGLAERPQLGVMIEVPSAALLADQLAKHADFLSIGSNDLTQYTLAMDRCNAALAARIDALHPGLLRLIAIAVDGASKHGKWVGVCGAMASDPQAVPVLIGLGVAELSVSPRLVPEVKNLVRGLSLQQCRGEAERLLALNSAQAVRARITELWPAA